MTHEFMSCDRLSRWEVRCQNVDTAGICRIFYGRREGITISRCYFTDITGILEKVHW